MQINAFCQKGPSNIDGLFYLNYGVIAMVVSSKLLELENFTSA